MRKRGKSAPTLDNPVLRHLIVPLGDLTRWLDAYRVPHAIVGPVADAILWQPRLSCAIDLLAAIPQGRGFARAGLAYGFAATDRDDEFIHEPTQIAVRMRRAANEIERQAISRPLRVRVYDAAVSVVAPEDLIALAFAADQDPGELLAAFPGVRPAETMVGVSDAESASAFSNALC